VFSLGWAAVTRGWAVLAAVIAFALLAPSGAPPPAPGTAHAIVLPSGFEESIAFRDLTNPTVVRFANDGRVFVAEKSGLIKVFDNLSDTTPATFADLRTNVYNFWDRGLLGMALAPNFPTSPYVYVLYTYDHILGDSSPAPRWGTANTTSDPCPTPPGPTTDGCVASARLSRLQASGNVMTGSEQVLVEDWCQQYPSHSIGTVEFGPDGALYAGGGDGASFIFADYGQDGAPLNPCGDPPVGVGGAQTPPSAEGGALRAQDLRTSGDPATLDGSIIRVDPATGAGRTDNPFAGSADQNMRRIIGYGLRNPFRFTFRPGSNEIWIGDVGWGGYEEINRIMSPSDAVVENFGWPCYEGPSRQDQYDSANLSICESLYGSPSADTKPFFHYAHGLPVAGESCPTSAGSSISGLSFEFAPAGSTFPTQYQGALFFADYTRDCIWAMKKNGNPIPSPGSIDAFVTDAANPVNIEFGPQGDLFYVDFDGGTIRRIHYGSANPPPPPPGTHYLSDLSWVSQINTNSPVVLDRSRDGNPLILNGTTFAKGLGTHAVSELTYYLGGVCTRFTANVGIDDEEGPNGSVVFQVYADSSKVYDSGVMTGATPTASVDVSVSGASQLRIVVTDGGDNIYSDHGDWALAQIQCGGADTTPPSVVATTPVSGSTTVSPAVSPAATFSEPMDAATLTASTFTLVKQGTSTPVTATVSYDTGTRAATLDPASDLQAGASYTAKLKSGTGGAKDVAGNPLPADFTWAFTVQGQPPPGTYYLSDLAFTSQVNSNTPVVLDRSRDGNPLILNGTTFAKGLGTHAVSELTYYLGGTCSRFTASVGIDDEVGSEGTVVFQVFADATKVYDSGVMAGDTPTASVDVGVSGASELRIAVTDGGDNINSDHGDWASAQIQCSGSDTSPPTVVASTPANGATGVAASVSPTATFSEAVNASTVTTSTFTLVKQGTTTPLAGSVSYNPTTRVATLDPSADLENSTTYTATVKGGPSGVKDLAGNALAGDVNWTFATAAGANQPPTPVIDSPPSTLAWKVGDPIAFSGHATDPEQGTLPASSLSWTLLQQHCPSTCHSHTVQTWSGVSSGSFNAPDHDYPSYLELRLTATDAGGQSVTTSVRLDPITVDLTFRSSPSGLQLSVGTASSVTPFTRTVIVGSTTSISATTPQVLGGTTYEFSSWSDGGAQTHNVVAPATSTTYTATYVVARPQNTALPTISGTLRVGRTLTAGDGTWSGGQPMTFAYQWLRCTTTALSSCTAITGATAKTYVAAAADVDLRLRVRVTATNAGGSGTATSNATGRIKR
jgi:glucose/arabinose dehydrogenase